MGSTTTADGGGGRRERALRRVLPLLFWLLVWQGLAMWVDRAAIGAAVREGGGEALLEALLYGKELLLPAPAAVAAALVSLVGEEGFWLSVGASLARIFAGFLLGVVSGTLLAAGCAACRWLEVLLAPAVGMIRATPVASFIILLLLWVHTGQVPCVCAALMVLPVLWGNVRQAIRGTDPLLLECARACRFDGWKRLKLVYLPTVLPAFSSGCMTAVGLAWKAGVAAEVLCLPRYSLGSQVYYAKIYLETPSLFAWTLVILALSFGLGKLCALLFGALERRWGA